MSHCCKKTDCDLKCCDNDGDCSTSMINCVYSYGNAGIGTRDHEKSHCTDWAGILAGSVIGGVIVLVVLIICCYFIIKFCQKRQIQNQQQQKNPQNINKNQQKSSKQNQIKQDSVHSFQESTCCICFLDLSVTKIIKLECKHKLHQKCLMQWRRKSNNCPTCRKQIIGFLQ